MAGTHFKLKKSLHGRQVGLSSTGGVVTQVEGSSDIDNAAQMWGPGMMETLSSNGAWVSNSGMTVISSGSTSGSSYSVRAPVAGVSKEIFIYGTATAVTLNTSATTIGFLTTSAVLQANLSTTLSIAGAAGGVGGGVLELRGLSTTLWAVRGRSAGITAST